MSDQLQRFIFDDAPARGAIVKLNDAWLAIKMRHDYPAGLQQVLGELLAASALFCANLKFEGSLILQIQGTGALKLAVVECTHDHVVRATAKWEGDLAGQTLREMVGNGQFVITIDQPGVAQPYQGIVPLEGDTVAEILEAYMQRSEQVDTCLTLAANDEFAAGMLLQKLPDGHGDPAEWETVKHLGSTLKTDELLQLPVQDSLYRLFHQFQVKLLTTSAVEFGCRCSREKVAGMLKMLGEEEVVGVLQEQGSIEVGCEFCNTRYVFDAADVQSIFYPVYEQPTAH
ncbi:Hsp33 family molecular chaperone HslO [Leeia oryzae]|uniref:Hsp33 family molecular chaperone HslO n=1 Tax=Leeia oryzae TaxID=356662 RepID=UPI000381852F|nr:Hsp33 family molecular chaperone HslO [Leeia oryzae]